ncbi:hypothetical protein LA76x_2948 [Lysobacter antibioticus]|uniref:Uncharacterized protein n=1 Tax=Lysobacter antibioticus TaxID=84531 RepID=A0A0S2FC51_LYSAN|nr:hypothetical protein LA76x_2948 [Lysobacter antibioticus]
MPAGKPQSPGCVTDHSAVGCAASLFECAPVKANSPRWRSYRHERARGHSDNEHRSHRVACGFADSVDLPTPRSRAARIGFVRGRTSPFRRARQAVRRKANSRSPYADAAPSFLCVLHSNKDESNASRQCPGIATPGGLAHPSAKDSPCTLSCGCNAVRFPSFSPWRCR